MRASAGFPGIPPKLFRLRECDLLEDWETKWQDWMGKAYLSDGGIWNNLGTQALFEDNFYWGRPQTVNQPKVTVCIDASAPLGSVSSWPFRIPGWAEIRALLRQATIQNANTVLPRATTLRQDVAREMVYRELRFKQEYLGVLVPITEMPLNLVENYATDLREGELRRGERPSDREAAWAFKFANQITKWLQGLRSEKADPDLNYLLQETGMALDTRPFGTDEGRRLAEIERTEEFHQLCKIASGGQASVSSRSLMRCLANCILPNSKRRQSSDDAVAHYPTTLGKVDRYTARQIVARGYTNTVLTLYVVGLIDRLTVPTAVNDWML
jgi:hypothetical protein